MPVTRAALNHPVTSRATNRDNVNGKVNGEVNGKRRGTQSPSPPPKRQRSKTNIFQPKSYPSGKAIAAPGVAKRPRAARPEPILVNPLPAPPTHQRPALNLFVWGSGADGQLGLGSHTASVGEISKPRKHAWVDEHMEDGTFGEQGAGIEAIVAGGMHSLIIDENGTVWSCGVNDDAALGRPTDDVPDPQSPGSFLDPEFLSNAFHPIQSLLDENFRAVLVVAGDSICAAVNDKGDLRAWGSFRAAEGSLGFSIEKRHQLTPTPILELPLRPGGAEKVSSVATGNNHLLVLTTHGNVYTWGTGEQSQLGRKVLERRKVHGTIPEKVVLGNRSRKVKVIGAGSYHSFAVDDKGDVWSWGLNNMGQTGTGFSSMDDSIVSLPQRVINLSKEELNGDYVVQITGGDHHSLFLTAAGKVYACGRANCGQLGISKDSPIFQDLENPDLLTEPALVAFPDADDPVVKIDSGTHNNSAVTKGGALYSWGQGEQSELGIAESELPTPHVIVRKEGGKWFAASVSCGGQHTLGLFRKKP